MRELKEQGIAIENNLEKKLKFYQMTSEECEEHRDSDLENGLTDKSAKKRIEIYGKNILTKKNRKPALLKFLLQFTDPLIILLLVTTAISLYLSDYKGGTVLSLIIIINAIIWYSQEAKAEKTIQKLNQLVHPSAKVKRDGEIKEIKVAELVPWDIILIQEWDSIPADVRIIENFWIKTNDFSMTGESEPMTKFTHPIQWVVELGSRNNLAYMGTTVAIGEGYGMVIATGMHTELGNIAHLSQELKQEKTPLQKEMSNIATKLTIWTVILSILLVVVALLADFGMYESFIFALGIAAAMVPQGLPAQIGIGLSLASGKLAKKNALVKYMASVETLWCVNMICTDKTGTLTKNEMTTRKLYLGGEEYITSWSWYQPKGEIFHLKKDKQDQVLTNEQKELRKYFFQWCITNTTALVKQPDKKHKLRYALGDPTEAALITLAEKSGLQYWKIMKNYPKIYSYNFDSNRKMMSTVCKGDKEQIVFTKWGMQAILDKCDRIFTGKTIRKITKKDKEKILKYTEKTAEEAMRNISFAYKTLDKKSKKLSMEELESNLIFLGSASIIDPPREDAFQAIQACKDAHIKVVMITGDYGKTAQAIAKKIGLYQEDMTIAIIKGIEMRKMTDIQILKQMKKDCVIFSRTSPEDKLRIVTLLKKKKNIIAVTGDGINDSPALKKADIGVSMWKIGTDVAKDASDIILLDDSFTTLTLAIKEGRLIYNNLKKTIISCITSNFGELFAILTSLTATSILNIPIMISAVQILAIDLLGEIWPLVSLTRDPAQKNIMKAKPRNVANHIINKKSMTQILISGLMMWGIAFANYLLFFVIHGVSPMQVETGTNLYMAGTAISYITIVLCQFMNILSNRTEETIFTKYLWSNKKLLYSMGISLITIMILFYVPVVASYIGFAPLSLTDWLLPLGGTGLFLAVREWIKTFPLTFSKK